MRNNTLLRRAGRVNFNWSAHPKVSVEAGVGVGRTQIKLALGDQATHGYLIGSGFGTPRTVQLAADGTRTGGWLNANQSVESISSVSNENLSTRITPTATLRYGPVSWFTNSLTLGADYLRQSRSTFYPKNSNNWYSVIQNTGFVQSEAADGTQYTLNYMGNINRRFGNAGWISTDLSLGSQWLNNISTGVNASGNGLITNTANSVSQTSANRVGGESYGQFKQHGIFGQLMIGLHDRLFVKLAERVDRSSAFARNAETFFLPSLGVSYVLTQEPSVQRILPAALSTLKLRAAYGETGRAPGATAALQTYVASPYVTDAGLLVVGGVAPGNPGNPDLKPERGTEWEGGFDLGLLRDRVGLELTYFNKTTKDLIVTIPLPVSAGFAQSPAANIGSITNKGFELSARATVIARRNLMWDLAVNMNTLENELVSVQNVAPLNNRRCFKPGFELAAFCGRKIQSIDTLTGTVIVGDTAELLGGQFPKREGSLRSTLTLFRNFRLYAQADGKWDYLIYNLGLQYRDRLNGANANSERGVRTREELGLSLYDFYRLRPARVRLASGASASLIDAEEDYYLDGSFVRLREVSLSWTAPTAITEQLRLPKGLTLTFGGRNLALWTDYTGYDPEVLALDDAAGQLYRADLFTVPQVRRLFARVNVQF